MRIPSFGAAVMSPAFWSGIGRFAGLCSCFVGESGMRPYHAVLHGAVGERPGERATVPWGLGAPKLHRVANSL